MSALENITESQYTGAVYCSTCHTHMHPSHAPTHAAHHDTETALHFAEQNVLSAVARASIAKRPGLLNVQRLDNDDDLVFIAHAELARRQAQKAYDEARK